MEVSLEKGLAKIELKPDNTITLSQIQTVVKRNGFAPKSAQLKLNGKVGSNQITIAKSNESVPAVLNGMKAPDPEKEYLIEGNLVIKEDSQSITLTSLQEK